MPDPTIAGLPPVLVLGALNLTALGLLGILSFYGARLQKKVDELSTTTFTRLELAGLEARAEQQREARHKENTVRLERIETKVDNTIRLETKLDAAQEEINRLRTWRDDMEKRLANLHLRRATDHHE